MAVTALAVGAVARAQAPPNDNCTTPTAISGNGTFAFDTTLATTSPQGQNAQNCAGPTGSGIDHDVWFCWTASCTGLVTIDTCGLTSVDTKIAFYTGGSITACPSCPAAGAAPLCCNDDTGLPGCPLQARINCEAVCCQKYLIQIGSKPGSPGGLGSINISCAPSAGTNCAQPCPGQTTEPQTNGCCGRKPNLANLPASAGGAGFYPNGTVAVATYLPIPPGDPFVVSLIDLADYPNNLPYSAPIDGAGACGATTLTPQGGPDWGGYRNSCPNPNPIYHHPNWRLSDLGTVFGDCLDDLGNIYVCHSSTYYADSLGSLGGAGSVYRLDTNTGVPNEFIRLPNTNDPNVALGAPSERWPGLGNICYQCLIAPPRAVGATGQLVGATNGQWFVSNLDDGRIYRLAIDPFGSGNTAIALSNYDHASGAIVSGGNAILPEGTDAPGWVPLGERVWGLEVYAGRLYYGVWSQDTGNFPGAGPNKVFSIALNPITGEFMGGPLLEVTVPNGGGLTPNPVASIAFSATGRMLLGERTMFDATNPGAHVAEALEYVGGSGSWVPSINIFTIGQLSPSCAGGVAYDYAPGGRVWVTGDALHLNNPDNIYGIQGLPASGGTNTNSILIDVDHSVGSQDKEDIGDVAISCPQTCVTPPMGMVAWWTFDEPSSTPPPQAQDIAFGHNGTWVPGGGQPVVLAGKVSNALLFNGTNTRVDVPDAPGLNFGASTSIPNSGDFSIDCWIRNSVPQGIQPIIDKRTANPVRGYTLFLGSGNLGFQLADGIGGQFTNYPTSVFVADGQWHHIAVTVDRDQPVNGGKFYKDGTLVAVFDPTVRSGSLSNTANLWIGERQPIPTNLFYEGLIDEVEIFNRVVPQSEIQAIYLADSNGKCKEKCHAPWDLQFCNNEQSRQVTLQICNCSSTGYNYSWSLAPLPPGPGCSIPGPTVFSPSSGSLFVPPHTCLPVTVTIGRPPGLTPNLVACYQMTVTNVGTGHVFHCNGSVQAVNQWCIHLQVGTISVNPILVSDVQVLNFQATNQGDPDGNLPYLIEAMSMDGGPAAVSLNGLPPGTRYIGNLSLAPGQTTTIPVSVRFTEHQPFRFFDVFIWFDEDFDGNYEASDSYTISSAPGSELNIDANPPLVSPYNPGQKFRDVLQNRATGGTPAPQGIGVPGTPDEGAIAYSPIRLTYIGSLAPSPAPSALNVRVDCTDSAGNGSADCPGVASVSPSAIPNTYNITLTAPPPPRECITISPPGTAPGQVVQYQVLPGDADLDGTSNTIDLLWLVQRLNDGTANSVTNRARYNIDRSSGAGPQVNTTDLLRLVQLLNGVNTTQVFNGASVAACP